MKKWSFLNTGIKSEPAEWHPESEPEHEPDEEETEPEEEIFLKSTFRFAQSTYHRSFIAKLIQGSEINKRYCSLLKNELLSYKKVHSSISFAGDTFNFGRKRLAVINIAGQTL